MSTDPISWQSFVCQAMKSWMLEHIAVWVLYEEVEERYFRAGLPRPENYRAIVRRTLRQSDLFERSTRRGVWRLRRLEPPAKEPVNG